MCQLCRTLTQILHITDRAENGVCYWVWNELHLTILLSSLLFVCLWDGVSRPKVENSVFGIYQLSQLRTFNSEFCMLRTMFQIQIIKLLPSLGRNPIPLLKRVVECFAPTGKRQPQFYNHCISCGSYTGGMSTGEMSI